MSNAEPEKEPPQNLPPHQEQGPGLMNPPVGPPPPMGYGAPPFMGYGAPPPHQYQVYPAPPGVIPVQPQQGVFITNVQPAKEPDYLGYSIFTMLCCFLPLGIAALIFSLKTQEANRSGDVATARRNSRLALTLDHTALGLGIALFVVGIVLIIVLFTVSNAVVVSSQSNPQFNYPWGKLN